VEHTAQAQRRQQKNRAKTVIRNKSPECSLCNTMHSYHETYECSIIAKEIEAKFDPILNLAQKKPKPARPNTTLTPPLPKNPALDRVPPTDKHQFHRNLVDPKPWTDSNEKGTLGRNQTTPFRPIIQRSTYGSELGYHRSSIALNKQSQAQTHTTQQPPPPLLWRWEGGGGPGPRFRLSAHSSTLSAHSNPGRDGPQKEPAQPRRRRGRHSLEAERS
jgi:hypothetical protein